MNKNIEVARPTICGFDNQKSPFSGVSLQFSQKPLKILKNEEKCFWLRVLGIYHKNFKHLPWTESVELAMPTICGFDTQKSP